MIIKRLLDRISLRPTRHPIDCGQLDSTWLDVGGTPVQLFGRQCVGESNANQAVRSDWEVIKFVGVSGRAERVGEHPFDIWSQRTGHIWVANPPGYGNSGGRPSLESQLDTGLAVYRYVTDKHAGRPVLLMGNSLGGAVAVCLAAQVACAGLIVRDLPHLEHIILARYGILGPFARAFARRVPPSLNVERAAALCHVPAVLVSSRDDRVVPATCQDRIIAAYAGPHRMVPAATDHMEPLTGSDFSNYVQALRWLEQQIVANRLP